ncbi:terminase large (ATPase) subunit and inactivated derivatives [Methylomagnum ishizawai]|uniref:Terminase large (ATPase) subunit and inactivated derivatives n=1 Tax=Methylomagnum ishizawai TaxID=1760988 RepID=A0A1Y6CVD7_9GAMM|nr:terminase large (ATPase) subunit and inactivated derivatives [Methylomagnum ishizawai]
MLALDRELAELERRRARRKLFTYYPETGPLRRGVYPKHLEFFRAGRDFQERCAMAANRIGKTEGMGGYECALHLTGRYPDWWPGRRFDRPVKAIVAGKLKESTRDIVQEKLFGPILYRGGGKAFAGTGLVPGDDIAKALWRTGINPPMADTVYVVHWKEGQPDGYSICKLKSYEQGRAVFEGFEADVFWGDEEPPWEVYDEAMIRLMTTGGLSMLTYTPLDGITEVVELFMPGIGIGPVPESTTKYTVNAGWDDAPHLSPEEIAKRRAETPKRLLAARSQGLPVLGSGLIFPVDDDGIVVDPFPLPDHWPRICGQDFGWDHPHANVWLAWDRETDTVYVYDEYAASESSAPIHASAIKARGDWIPVAWPADGLQHEKGSGTQLAGQYRAEGVAMLHEHARFPEVGESTETESSRVSVEAGLNEMLTRMETGRWKVFRACQGWLKEKAIYRRDKKGKIVKTNDDRIDASRYGLMMLRFARTRPVARDSLSGYYGRKAGWR